MTVAGFAQCWVLHGYAVDYQDGQEGPRQGREDEYYHLPGRERS
jgi:hypothetical protein